MKIGLSSRYSRVRSSSTTHWRYQQVSSVEHGATVVARRGWLGSDHVEIEALDDQRARAAGQLCGATGVADVIDASAVLCARGRGHRLVTSDPADIRRRDPTLAMIVV